MPDKFTAKEMNRAIYRHFTPRWAVLTEVTARARQAATPAQALTVLGTEFPGSAIMSERTARDRRIDVLLVRAANKPGGIERVAIEIKVSRSDFLSDVRDPTKQAPWRSLAHRHAYAVPEGLVAEREVPADSGLIVVTRRPHGDQVAWARLAKAPAGHEPDPLPMANIMDAFWRAARAEAQMRGYGFDTGDDEDDPAQLRAEVKRLRHENGLLNNRLDREQEAKEKWQKAYGAVGHPPCGTCGKPLKPGTGRRGKDWTHAVPADNAPCDERRRDIAETEDQQRDPDLRQPRRYLWVPEAAPADLPDLEVAS
jgi:hypothetical protein